MRCFAILLLLLTTTAGAQTVWNKTYVEDRPVMIFSSITAVDTDYFISGITLQFQNGYPLQRTLLAKINSIGVMSSYQSLQDSTLKDFAVFYNTTVQGGNNILWTCGYSYDSLPRVMLIRQTLAGLIQIFEYSTPNSYSFKGHKLLRDGNSCYITGVRTDSTTNNGDVVLMKIDSSGNRLWQKYYNQKMLDYAKSIVPIPNGHLMLGCVRSDNNQTHEHANTWLLEVDTAGNMVRQWFDPNDSTYAAEGLLYTSDNGFIYGAQKKYSESGGLVSYTNTIVKMDYNFNKQWIYKGGYRGMYTGISDIEELSDGSFIACGQYPIYAADTALWGCVIKLGPAGDLIWEKTYRGINASQSLNFLSDIDVLPDGGFIAVGQCQLSGATPPQVGWFLNLDSNGCEVENCLVGIDPQPPKGDLNSQIQVWPNPASDVVQIEMSSEMIGGEIKLYDVTGQAVKEWRVTSEKEQVNVSDVSKGLYLITATKNNHTARAKLVVE